MTTNGRQNAVSKAFHSLRLELGREGNRQDMQRLQLGGKDSNVQCQEMPSSPLFASPPVCGEDDSSEVQKQREARQRRQPISQNVSRIHHGEL